jgi:hypothetical protein
MSKKDLDAFNAFLEAARARKNAPVLPRARNEVSDPLDRSPEETDPDTAAMQSLEARRLARIRRETLAKLERDMAKIGASAPVRAGKNH